MALRRLQEENENLQQENKRLRAALQPEPPAAAAASVFVDYQSASAMPQTALASAPEVAPLSDAAAVAEPMAVAEGVGAPAELSRMDVGMSC